MNRKPVAQQAGYNDLVYRLIFAIAGAHLVTEFGGNEPWLQRLFTKEYYIEFGSTLAITLLIIHMVWWATVVLDRNFPWHGLPVQRVLLQLLLGLVVPTFVTLLLASGYFALYGLSIFDTNYHLYALPFIVALIAIFNIYYYIRYLLAERARLVAGAANTQPILDIAETAPENGHKQAFLVHTPTRSFPVAPDTIAYFYRDDGGVHIRLFDGADYLLARSLDAIEQQVDGTRFFRVARHMIASYEAIRGYHPLNFGKLGLTIRPAYKEPVNVSKPQARHFKQWYDR